MMNRLRMLEESRLPILNQATPRAWKWKPARAGQSPPPRRRHPLPDDFAGETRCAQVTFRPRPRERERRPSGEAGQTAGSEAEQRNRRSSPITCRPQVSVGCYRELWPELRHLIHRHNLRRRDRNRLTIHRSQTRRQHIGFAGAEVHPAFWQKEIMLGADLPITAQGMAVEI